MVIIDTFHSEQYFTPVVMNGITTLIDYSAVYKIIVDYNGVEFTIDDEKAYTKYKDRIGETVNGTLMIRTYDNGHKRYDIISLE